MEKESRKRMRASNFTPSERVLLVNIVARHKNIIENKQTNNATTHEKNSEWDKICNEFNASSSNCMRSKDCLKRFCENQKKQTRKLAAEEKKETYLTGGGPLPKFNKDPSHDLLLSIINEKTVCGLTNKFDSDKESLTFISNAEPDSEVIEIIVDENRDDVFENNIEDSTEDNQDSAIEYNENNENEHILTLEEGTEHFTENNLNWKKYKPAHLLSTTSAALRTPNVKKNNISTETPTKKGKSDTSRRRPVLVKALTTSELAEKYNALLEKRLDIAAFQKNTLESGIAMANEEHRLKMQLLKVQIEIEREKLKQIKRNDVDST